MVRGCPMLPSLPLDFVPLHSSSQCWVLSLRSSAALTVWDLQMILATSGLALTVLGLAPSSFCSTCVLRCPALAWSQDGTSSIELPGSFSPGQRHAPCYRDRDEVAVGPQGLPLGGRGCNITPLHACALDKDRFGHLLLTTEHCRVPRAGLPDGLAASQCHCVI